MKRTSRKPKVYPKRSRRVYPGRSLRQRRIRLRRRRVFVAISGGVDSSVALALLARQGYDVVGCFMKNWSQDLPGLECNWMGDREDAIRVCATLGVPFRTVDLEKAYRQKVLSYFIGEYRKGRTPNPDVMCNSEIKFKAFLQWARRNGADMIATGHYARIGGKPQILNLKSKTNSKLQIPNAKNLQATAYKLLAGRDSAKDQSYFLYRLGQRELHHALFPIGGYTKPEVRRLAHRFGLPTAAKPDSQGVCFVGEIALRKFLANWIPEKKGRIVLTSKGHSNVLKNIGMSGGAVIGEHPGARYFTIGQRHGLGLKGGSGKPLYVAVKDVRKNILYVAPKNHPLLYRKELMLTDVHWVSGIPPKLPLVCKTRIRYRQPLQNARIMNNKTRTTRNEASVIRHSSLVIRFAKPQWAPAAGQSVVFYNEGEILGGGIIA